MIKLMAIDLDGTLLNSDKQISAENVAALHYAHDLGVKIVLCTGRPYHTMKEFVSSIGLNSGDDYIITFNGGQVQKADTGQVLARSTISQADMLLWDQEMKRLDLPLNIIDGDYVYEPLVYPEASPSRYVGRFKDLATRTLDYQVDFRPDHLFNKFVVCAEPDYLDARIPLIDPQLKADFAVYKSQNTLLEIMPAGVTKAFGLAKLGDLLGIKAEEMMTFGDQANDQTMIEYAGIGVAMGNAIDSLKKVADYVTTTNDQNGVAQAIYHFMPKERR
ncbi:Cof-type HAD-IIB family hydrolase [Vaginisenegalia massiliensis]|uniref:Cof-type HAD-IIB family hydrolase n=1 Tax=Vaginisenegalia massiliensis TaxID=2058294 RepID=UPI000F534FA7|nr:Cof-type HAD-IIB family hydrolase [Vaginisenegalia massiliensis]